MSFFAPILAQESMSAADAVGAWASMTEEARTRLIMFSAYALVILVLVGWAIFIRKQKNERRRVRKNHPHTWQQSGAVEKRHRRHHRKRSRDLSQNPSLAAAGGLPPRRPDDVPPKGT